MVCLGFQLRVILALVSVSGFADAFILAQSPVSRSLGGRPAFLMCMHERFKT